MSVVVIMKHSIACRAKLCKIHDKDYTILIGVRDQCKRMRHGFSIKFKEHSIKKYPVCAQTLN